MSNYTVQQIDEMEAIYNDSFRRAGAELGVESELYERPEPFKLGAPDPTAAA